MTNPLDHIPDGGKTALDALAWLAALGTVASILPPIAAALSIIWLSLQIYGWVETRLKAAKPPQN